ncbi:MAG TPA: peptide chain release factor N(5)-glutamine methyltransferase [Dehalococcoidia bacterium]|nr:peptide chain release factor N(5)-glutamine methyltransferase [Dehalococcoidia bacterium]
MSDSLTLRQALLDARARLDAALIEEAELEADLLLRHAMGGLGRAALFQRLGDSLDAATATCYEALLARRLAHEPSAYITGHREFYGLEFAVTSDVLIPRPETETLVEAVIELAKALPPAHRGPLIADVGTGSGAIAVALAVSLPCAEVWATDASWAALEVARSNARRNGVERRIALRHGDLLLPLDQRLDVIVANLPYVSSEDWSRLEPELREHEPRLALDGGTNGLDLIASLLHQAPGYLRPHGAIVLEFALGQETAVERLTRAALPGATLRVLDDLTHRPRALVAECP